MPPRRITNEDRKQKLAAEQKLQVGGALLLGFIFLIVIIVRGGLHTIFLPNWWRF